MAGSKRRRELARTKFEGQEARRAVRRVAAQRRARIIGAVVGVAAVLLAGVGITALLKSSGSDTAATTPSPAASASVSPTAESPSPTPQPAATLCPKPPAPPATTVAKLAAEFPILPPLTIDTKAIYTMTVATNCGDIVASLDAAKAPKTVNALAYLASKDFFTNTPCHRLTISGLFVLQCGDPTGTGTGGPGFKIPDENLPKNGTNNYPAGTVAMANAGAGTTGSQFFLVYKDTTLGPNYTVVGRITSGLDVVTKVASAGTSTGESSAAPRQSISLLKVTIAKGK